MAGLESVFSSMASMASVMTSPVSTALSFVEAVGAPGKMTQDSVKISAEGAAPKLGATLATYPGGFACATATKVASSPREMLNGLMSDWNNWWLPGKARDLVATPEGGVKFKFRPISTMGVGLMDVGVELKAPIFSKTAAGHDVIRVPLKLTEDLQGHGFFEMRALPGGGSLVRSVWEDAKLGGLKQFVPGMSDVIGRAHLAVEDVYLKCLDGFSKNLTKIVR